MRLIEYHRREHRCRRSALRLDQRLGLGTPPLAPTEQLLRIEVVPAGDLRHVHHTRRNRLRDIAILSSSGHSRPLPRNKVRPK